MTAAPLAVVGAMAPQDPIGVDQLLAPLDLERSHVLAVVVVAYSPPHRGRYQDLSRAGGLLQPRRLPRFR